MPRNTLRIFKRPPKKKKDFPGPFSQPDAGQTFHRQFVSQKTTSKKESKFNQDGSSR